MTPGCNMVESPYQTIDFQLYEKIAEQSDKSDFSSTPKKWLHINQLSDFQLVYDVCQDQIHYSKAKASYLSKREEAVTN